MLECHNNKSQERKSTKLEYHFCLPRTDRSTKLQSLATERRIATMFTEFTFFYSDLRSNRKARMSGKRSGKWVKSWNNDLVSLGRKVCLLTDDRSAHHCNVSISNIELCFLPSNMSVLQLSVCTQMLQFQSCTPFKRLWLLRDIILPFVLIFLEVIQQHSFYLFIFIFPRIKKHGY